MKNFIITVPVAVLLSLSACGGDADGIEQVIQVDVPASSQEDAAAAAPKATPSGKDDVFEIKPGSEDEKILHGRTSAGAPIGLSSNQGPVGAASVQQESPTEMRFNGVARNHSHHQWRASVELNGETYKSSWWKEPRFPAEFKLLSTSQTLHPSNWDTCEYEDTDDGESEWPSRSP